MKITASLTAALALAAGATTAQDACYFEPEAGVIKAEGDAAPLGQAISPVAEAGDYSSFFWRGEDGTTILVHDCASGAHLTINAGSSGRSGLIWEFEALMEGAGDMSLEDIAAGIGADVDTTIGSDEIGNCDCLALGLGG
ncbi:hypothetical protein [Pseudoroseicyclus tamaricis]|uniref:Uncharacterized protein n=1 Tax=Pseudoroseicyclus tamaricis TaxID=2705421 RepID=A0A6B2JUV3_9RHOB|nr:hypothetical protein [Pseudoroseicyclus tamaricis]NDV01675.1 hypothetical protein [Pseudoroseicyclus tamaricis]